MKTKLSAMPTMAAARVFGRSNFCSTQLLNSTQVASNMKLSGEEFMSKLLDRRWTMPNPDTKIHQVMISPIHGQNRGGGSLVDVSFFNNTQPCLGKNLIEENQGPSFYILRDDLLHPLVNGNKARKLDALFPLLEDRSITDVVTCGGCQSAHTAAVAVSCAERGLKSHLLLRGEQPEILTGYNLISTVYGNVKYIPRSVYAQRDTMLQTHASSVAGSSGVIHCDEIIEVCSNTHTSKKNAKKVVIVNEGAGDAIALLGIFRLVQYLSQDNLLGTKRALNFIIDAGTGTTAIGLGLGALCLGLPWKVTAVMLADKINAYREQERRLITDFNRQFHFSLDGDKLNEDSGGIVHWVERFQPRKFGNILQGEMEVCQQIAQQTGILVDPVYTLAAWEMATLLSSKNGEYDANVVMLHTGGTLGMFGLAQRYKTYFHNLKNR